MEGNNIIFIVERSLPRIIVVVVIIIIIYLLSEYKEIKHKYITV